LQLESAKILIIGGGMRKRISCKVVRSIPLIKSSDELRHSSTSNIKSDKFRDTAGIPNTKKYAWEPAVTTKAKHAGYSVTYTDRLSLTRIPLDNGLTAQTLDFYV
jgi:hypothetical protein